MRAVRRRRHVLAVYLGISFGFVSPCLFGGAVRPFDVAREGIRPVRVVTHVPRPGGPDVYRFDWAVDPGPWPMVTRRGVLHYPMGAYGAGHLPGECKTIEDWWVTSDFDFVHFQASVRIGDTGSQIARRNIQYVMNPAGRVGRRVVAHLAYTCEMQGPQALVDHINAIKDHPALWGYDAADEPSSPERVISIAHGFQMIRALDPEHPILVNDIGNQKHPSLEPRIRPDKPDFYSWDVYPVQSNNGVSLETTYTRNLVRICRERGITPGYVLGNFARGEGPHLRQPWFPRVPPGTRRCHYGRFSTVEELRSQVYQSIIAGVKMLMWWPWGQWVGGVYNRADLREATYQVNREVHALTGPILSKLALPVSFGVPAGDYIQKEGVVGMVRIYRDDVYVFVANIAEKNVPLRQRTPAGGLALKGVKIILDRVPATYRRFMDDKAEVLFEIAGKDKRGVPIYVKQKQGRWRTVRLISRDRDGKPAVRLRRYRNSLWGPEWTGEKPERPDRGTAWGLWQGGKASTVIVDDFPPYAVHIYRIRLHPLGSR